MADEPKNNDEKKIPMFTGDNFPMWERKMRMHLRGLKLFGIIEEPWSEEPSATELELSERSASALVKGLEDHKPSRNCRNGHNPNLGHTEDECHVLHPEKKPEWMKKRDKASAHFTAAELSMSTQEPSTSLVRPSFGYNSMLGDGSDTLSMVLDSGASHHMLNNIGYFQHSRKVLMQITTGNDKGDH
ncbi:hypothetical protein MJO29_001051, partial [Puccinia striiformis f. sp. tritici]